MEGIWDEISDVYITSFWGWSPDTWGNVGFTRPGRRETIVGETSDPFIFVIYVARNSKSDRDLYGLVTGFYVVTHSVGHRNEFTDSFHHDRSPEKWTFALRAVRAFSFIPERRIGIDTLDPTIRFRGRSVAANGERLSPEKVRLLQDIPYGEVPVFGGIGSPSNQIIGPVSKGYVKAGPKNRSGYMVSGEPEDTPKELYALTLEGDMRGFLQDGLNDRRVYKIGMSLSPLFRLECFKNALPRSRFSWVLHRSTSADGRPPYPCFEAAEAGEMAMKLALSQSSTWLNGEFYAATDAAFEAAWRAGHEAAAAYSASKMIV